MLEFAMSENGHAGCFLPCFSSSSLWPTRSILLPDQATFSFPLRPLSSNGSSTVAPGKIAGGPFLLNRFHGDKENALVRTWCDATAFNQNDVWPLVLYGASGVGKSALAETLACQLSARLKVLCTRVSGNDFRRRFHAAAATKSIPDFVKQFRDYQMLFLDDVLINEADTALNREFSQLLDYFRETQRPLLVTMLATPWSVPVKEIGSRLSAGLSLKIKRPGMSARRAIVADILRQLNLSVQSNDVDWLVDQLPSTVPLIKQGLSKVALACSQLSDSDLVESQSPQLTRRTLKRLMPGGSNTSIDTDSIQQITKLVARQLGSRVSDIHGKSRKKEIVRARSTAMYLVRNLLMASFREVGDAIGRRDASTVRHACRQIETQIPNEPVLAEVVEVVTARFNQWRELAE